MKRLFRFLMIVVSLSASMVFAVLLRAQEDMTAPEPPEEASQMDWFLGDWNIASRVKMSDDPEEWLEETATSTVSSVLGRFAIMETYTGTLGGTPIDAVSIRTYNSNLGKWEQRWLDNTSPGFAEYTGEYADGEFVGVSNRSFKPEAEGGRGETTGVREVFYDIEENRFSWRLETTQDNGETWEPVWYLEYTRTN